MPTKQKGKCPFCGENVAAVVMEENTVRRDRCKCPKCEEEVFVCRAPHCHNYAKGTKVYDHEFCPECTAIIQKAAEAVGDVGLKVLGGILAAKFGKKFK